MRQLARPAVKRSLTDAQLDRLDRLEGRYPGSRFELLRIEISGAVYEVEGEWTCMEILITPSGRVLCLS